MPLQIFFADDSAREREEVKHDLELFVPEADVLVSPTVIDSIGRIEEIVRCHAAILDMEFADERLTCAPIAIRLQAVDPEFFDHRVALRTSASEETARSILADRQAPFPSMYIPKGHLSEMIDWVKGLPERGVEEVSTRALLTPQSISDCLTELATESRDTHGCPDFSGKIPELSQALFAMAQHHPALQGENRYNDNLFRQLGLDLNAYLLDQFPDQEFPEDVRMKRKFMLYSWAGRLANMIVQ